jgi:hypothetical protein
MNDLRGLRARGESRRASCLNRWMRNAGLAAEGLEAYHQKAGSPVVRTFIFANFRHST